MAWMQSHQVAYRKAMESYFSSPWYFPPSVLQSTYGHEAGNPGSGAHHVPTPSSHCSYLAFRRSGQHTYDSSKIRTSTVEDQALSKEEEVESESDEEVEYDLSNMEITKELRQYYAETERHREERQWQQQLEVVRLDDYVNADNDLYHNPRWLVEPPAERPGEWHKVEMRDAAFVWGQHQHDPGHGGCGAAEFQQAL
ncbi:Gem-associated protein 8 [Tupaia chinensis]|uniref:Gem-associated protein 8 n=1 Tax=Tupaia chinensis TaxID=246437 RepID=L9JDL9_TUPCH|nr:Gem-associated protein 8 [Tupaia chinensis]